MNASKENATKAMEQLDGIISCTESQVIPRIAFLREFLEAAMKRLPTEAAIAKDKLRKRNYKRSKAGTTVTNGAGITGN